MLNVDIKVAELQPRQTYRQTSDIWTAGVANYALVGWWHKLLATALGQVWFSVHVHVKVKVDQMGQCL